MYPTAPPTPLQPIRALGTAAVVMLAADSLVSVLSSAVDVQRALLIDRFLADPASASQADGDASDTLYALSGLVETVVYVATAVVFLVWLFRARTNAETLSPWPHRRARPWLVFGWGFPVLCWWYPKQIVDDIWTASKPGAVEETGNLATARRSGLIWAWWLAWLVSMWIAKGVGRRYLNAEELPEMREAALFDIAVNAAYIVTAALTVAVVLSITRFQEDRRTAATPMPSVVQNPAV
ncbi:DUF4328 domain-containing protein [Microbispora amethystogenes]|uniref:DUF4328 domain-containing protein n=1 Tax=Microbispora amethystogenes TaxID=1427754 RepID=A0ABQ4F6R9_9ACTN|nr:DUF4328 domain-containing protein [Microbispora amethystogenes]GIH30468.1 hypothetical protein Mam01_06320 [Microbispora amethystogenes]